MKNLTSKLPIVAFVLAAVFAFAFTEPSSQMGHAPIYDENNPTQVVGWIDVSTLEIGEDYRCNESTNDCLYAEQDLNSPVVREGDFELL